MYCKLEDTGLWNGWWEEFSDFGLLLIFYEGSFDFEGFSQLFLVYSSKLIITYPAIRCEFVTPSLH